MPESIRTLSDPSPTTYRFTFMVRYMFEKVEAEVLAVDVEQATNKVTEAFKDGTNTNKGFTLIRVEEV